MNEALIFPTGQHLRTIFLDDHTVRLVAVNGLYASEANAKVEKLDKLTTLVSDIPAVKIPRVIKRNDRAGIYEIERAGGVNLDNHKGFFQGNLKQFLAIETKAKVSGFVTYLRVVEHINDAGISFIDHKTDSVFIEEDGTVWIVDNGEMREEDDPWRDYDRDPNHGLAEVLRAFFTRGVEGAMIERSLSALIPAGLNLIVSDIKSIGSSRELIERLKQYQTSKYKPPYVLDRDSAIDEPGLTDWEYDVKDAERWRLFELRRS